MISSLWEFATWWKKQVLLSPSFTNRTRDSCLQKISFKEAKWAISPLIKVWQVCSSCMRPKKSSLASKLISSNLRLFFLNARSPNSSLFHFFKSSLKAFNFQAKRAQEPIPTPPLPSYLHKTLIFQPHIFEFKSIATFTDTTSFHQKWTMIRNHSREYPLRHIPEMIYPIHRNQSPINSWHRVCPRVFEPCERHPFKG